MTPSSPIIVASFRSASRSIAAAVVFLAILVIAGRLTARAWPSTVSEPIKLASGSALAFLLTGVSLWLQGMRRDGRARRYAAACAIGAMVLSAAAWGGTLRLWPVGSASLFIPPQSSAAFLLIGAALALLDWETRRRSRPAQTLALGAAAIASAPVVGHLYGLMPLDANLPVVPIHESIALLMLAAAVLLARPEGGLIGLATHETAGGFLVRWMPVAVIALPLALGWLALQSHRLGWLGPAPAFAGLVLMISTFFLLLIFRVARSLDRVDLDRARAEHQLRVRARQRAEVAELARRGLSGVPIDALTSDAVRLVVDGLEVEAGEFIEIHSNGTASVMASLPRSEGGRQHAPLSGAPSLHGYVLESNESAIIDDLARDRRVGDARLSARGVVSAAVVVVRGATRPYGTLAACSWRPGAFTTDDLPLLQTVAGILAAARDCLAGEEARRLSEEKFSIVFRASPDAITIGRLSDGMLIDVNPSFLQMTGFAQEDVLGRSAEELGLWPNDTESPPVGTGTPVRNMEARFRTKEGRIRVGLCSTEAITLNGDACMLTVVRDISERREEQAAIQRANDGLTRWVKELEIRGREISLLNDMGEFLQTCLTPADVCTVVMRFAQQLLPGSRGAVCTICDGGRLLEGVVVWGDLSGDEVVFAPQECWALRRGRAHLVRATGVGPVCAHMRSRVAGLTLCVPMMAQGETLGVLHVRDAGGVLADEEGTGARFTESKEELVVALAGHVALALANLRLRETLRSQSIRDPLTGLYNRRHMEESLAREVRRARRARRSVGLILMDLDRFKSVNDLHGHEAGDELLKAVGRVLRGQLRADDIACRYGGDEFLFVMPEAAYSVAMGRAEELGRAIRDLRIWPGGQLLLPVSASAGVVTFPENGTETIELLRAADAALYRAKAQGGDRVEAGHVDTHVESRARSLESDPGSGLRIPSDANGRPFEMTGRAEQ